MSAIATITYPTDYSITSAPACSSGTTNLTCSLVSANKISITFATVQQINTVYNFTMVFIANPYSFKPTASITVSTFTSDMVYAYSSLSSGL